jgi:hypothetical protein
MSASKEDLRAMASDDDVFWSKLDEWTQEAGDSITRAPPFLATEVVDTIFDQASTLHENVGRMSHFAVTVLPSLNWKPTDLEKAWAQRAQSGTALPQHIVDRMEPVESDPDQMAEITFDKIIRDPYCPCQQPMAVNGLATVESELLPEELQSIFAHSRWNDSRFDLVRGASLRGQAWSLVYLDPNGNFIDQPVSSHGEGEGIPEAESGRGVGLKITLGDWIDVSQPGEVPVPRKGDPSILKDVKASLLFQFVEHDRNGTLSSIRNDLSRLAALAQTQGPTILQLHLERAASAETRWLQTALAYAALPTDRPRVNQERWGETRSQATVAGFDPSRPDPTVPIHKIQVTIGREVTSSE